MKTLVLCGAVLSMLLPAPPRLFAQNKGSQQAETDGYNTNTWSQTDAQRIVQEVRHKLLGLTDYGVFDSLSFGIQGRSIVVHGYASRPILKSEAERTIKGIDGISEVQNQIKVLPNSPNDDSIRIGVYRRIYGQPALRKYTGSPVGFGDFPSVARMAGGITQDPPRGYHAIHIIVDDGHVTLTGVVDNESDANIASMQANSTPGTFSVDNDCCSPSNTKRALSLAVRAHKELPKLEARCTSSGPSLLGSRRSGLPVLSLRNCRQ